MNTESNSTKIEYLINRYATPIKNENGKKIKAKLTKRELIALIMADPRTKMNDVDPNATIFEELIKIKAGRYSEWIVKRYLEPKTERTPEDFGYEEEVTRAKEVFMEDLYKVANDLKKFDRFKGKLPKGDGRHIDKYTVDTLYDAVKDFDLTLATTTKSERKNAEVHPGSKLVYDGKNWRVIEISDNGSMGKEAACFYGGNNVETRWCTSAPGTSWFERYANKGPLYVIYDPNDTNVASMTGLPKERFQFHFPDNQFMDKDDRQQDLISLLNGRMSELKEFFKPEFAKGLTAGGEKLIIDSFSNGIIGKFIALYGLEDLFSNLPETLKMLQIQNRDTKSDIIINIPKEISRFKELSTILLDNCISEIPAEISELKKLRFLALINNPKLTSIPDNIADLPNLYFLNLKGSDNVKVPSKIMDRAYNLGNGMLDLQK